MLFIIHVIKTTVLKFFQSFKKQNEYLHFLK